jgi:hypothetical protein
MDNAFRGTLIIAVAAATLLAARDGLAQFQFVDAGASYSQGVHAYFAGRNAEAEAHLSSAIARDPQDVRAHYFRALARLRQGRRDEARADMQRGASLEAQQPGRFAIGTVLERVQGPDRLMLELYRQQARQSEASQRAARDQARYGQVLAREAGVLHRKATIPFERLMQPAGEPSQIVVYQQSPRPEPAWAAARQPVPPAPAAPAALASPFGDDPVGPATAATPPATAAPAPAAASSPSDNPFGDAPIGPAQPATPPARVAPAPTPQPAPANDNPFGFGG